ncbi:hypothetical protein Vadar_028590 [Vaccinium darrowii]|uniref:Uncharacterized protein n=1 Tax=Vaccinium darrowii TaxID=229202 RepID=A0ACB7Y9K3_9ERIC|nr:hypothetical protein Vadar_028590 [Vaccinium darrowii]
MAEDDRTRRSSLKTAMMQQPLRSSLCCCDEGGDRDSDPVSDNVDLENINNDDDLDRVSKLLTTQRYLDIMQKVEDALEIKGSDLSNSSGIVVEDYQLIVDCTALLVDIENEIFLVHNFIRDNYRLKFPELQSLVHHPIDYARVVKKIGNEMDLTRVNLDGLLPSAIIMVDSITATTTSGKRLPEQILRKTIEACDRALALHSAKKTVLDFLETRMGHIAPNLSAIVGSAVAAKLVVTAGGLSALANIPACTVRLLGANETNLVGFSTAATYQFCVGYIEQTEISQSTPPSLRLRACRLLAAKSTVAARIDSISEYPTGDHGRAVCDKIHKIIAEWQEPTPAKRPTSLPPVPDCKPKKESDGRRCKKMKLSYAMTDQRKMANKDYQLIVDCPALSVDIVIENEIFTIHNFIQDNYRSKFPELQSLVHHPIDYARVVKKICSEIDLTREKVLGFLESRMEHIARNLAAIVGSTVTAKLVVTAGGLLVVYQHWLTCLLALSGSLVLRKQT